MRLRVNPGVHIPAAVLGALVGWFLRSFLIEQSIPLGDVLGAIVTVVVGWQIQRTLGRQAELSHIPMSSVSRLSERVERLIGQCLDAAHQDQGPPLVVVQSLRSLANEITWLGSVVQALEVAEAEHSRLETYYLTFKGHLTGGHDAQMTEAETIGRSMRTLCLQIQWSICRRILDHPEDLGSLAPRVDAKMSIYRD